MASTTAPVEPTDDEIRAALRFVSRGQIADSEIDRCIPYARNLLRALGELRSVDVVDADPRRTTLIADAENYQ